MDGSGRIDRLMEISRLRDCGDYGGQPSTPDPDTAGYLDMLRMLESVNVPEPSRAKVMAGRAALMQALSASPKQRDGTGWLPALRLALSGVPMIIAVVSVLAVTSGAAALSGVHLPGALVDDVLASVGLAERTEKPAAIVIPQTEAEATPSWVFDTVLPLGTVTPGPAGRPDPGVSSSPPAVPEAATAAVQPGQLDGQTGQPPGTKELDRHQEPEPPGKAGPNGGGGVEPPGQGGDNPGQGVEPPGHGGGNPGHGGENPGQGNGNGGGAQPPGQGGQNPERGQPPSGDPPQPPGLGGFNPGQGQGNAGGSQTPGRGGAGQGQGQAGGSGGQQGEPQDGGAGNPGGGQGGGGQGKKP